MPRIYNLKIDRLPPNKFLFVKKIPMKATLPVIIDLSINPRMPPVYDQGDLGSCTANALVAAFAFVHKPSTFTGSRLFLYFNERMVENDIDNDSGATLYSGVECLKKYGVCPESRYPYIISRFTKPPPALVYKEALKHKLIKAENLPSDLISMKNALASGFPFVVGIAIYSEFESDLVASTGMVPMPKANSRPLGGHAVLVVGYDDRTKLFKVRNSWGRGWGIKGSGYFFLPYAYLDDPSLSSDLWVISSVT